MTFSRFVTITALALTIAIIPRAVPAGAQVKAADIITRHSTVNIEEEPRESVHSEEILCNTSGEPQNIVLSDLEKTALEN